MGLQMKKNIHEFNFLAPADLEKQEHLELQRLKALTVNEDTLLVSTARPESNFIDLMEWVQVNYGEVVLKRSEQDKFHRFVHNRIIVDGQFLEFAKLKGITVKPLLTDSVVSWKTDNGYEKFFMQGVFHIYNKDCEFLHSALFHKGNQNEDEISFFVLLTSGNYDKYLQLRNEFDEWVSERDRGNLHIRVIDGEDQPYTRDHSWEELFFPEQLKRDIRVVVESFLEGKDFYVKNRIPWKQGLLLFGPPGNGKTTLIRTIISNYNFKPVTIAPGADTDAVKEAFSYAEDQSPSLLYFEDLDSLLERVDISSFLNLMDGVTTKNGLLVVATANDLTKLKTSITDRPSRFDKKYEVPLPDEKMCIIYLKKWFNNLISQKKCQELAKKAVKLKFSYAYLKELYISSMFEARANNRQVPNDKDISKALDRLMKDKNILRSSKIVDMDKYIK